MKLAWTAKTAFNVVNVRGSSMSDWLPVFLRRAPGVTAAGDLPSGPFAIVFLVDSTASSPVLASVKAELDVRRYV